MNLRYEIKYVLELDQFNLLQTQLRFHPAGVKKLYDDRFIHNVYYDSAKFHSFYENLAGISERKKYRVRWYNHQKENARGEEKIKINQLGYKEFHDLGNVDFMTVSPFRHVPIQLLPVLENQYLRSYYSDHFNEYRITVDRNIQYRRPCSTHAILNEDKIIVEIKFDRDKLETLDRISQIFPFRPNKNSKYVNGMFRCYNI